MNYSLGIIETRGMLGAIEAADAMTKGAQVTVSGIEKVGGGLISVSVVGEVAAVTEAVAVGKRSAEKLGVLAGALIIARPHESLSKLALEQNRNYEEENELLDFENLSVVELRKYVRALPGFPIHGREISRANREILLNLVRRWKEEE